MSENGLVWLMVFNATFNNISFIQWRSVLLVEETGIPGENHRPAVNHWQTMSHNVVWTGFEPTTLMVIGTDCIGSCKSNYHMITTTMPLIIYENDIGNLISFARNKLYVIGQCTSPRRKYNSKQTLVVISCDFIDMCKYNYHTITTTLRTL
jgi:hypothetical protein